MDWAKLWPSMVAAVPALIAPFYDQITLWISGHPTAALLLGTVATIVANLTKSPTQPPTP